MALSLQIEQLISPVIDQLGYELVRVQLQGSKRLVLQVMAERRDRQPMKVEDCATLSREISAALDAADPITVEYVLEVSSPGIDRPLMKPADYARFASHEAKIELDAPLDGRKRFQGVIARTDSEAVILDVDGASVSLPFGRIKQGRLILTDRLIEAAQSAEDASVAQASVSAG
jgi:ribosome maturation factor RimP